MRINRNIHEISAEMLLNYLYPEMEERWVAHHDGAFYRNYNADAMSIDEEHAVVRLSRDGFLNLLPQGLLTREEELKGKDFKGKYEELERRRRVLHEAFLPFDTFLFRHRLAIERQVSELLNDKLRYILKEYFNFELTEETDPLVREAAVMLPFVSRFKGDLGFISKLLSSLLKCEVETKTGRYSQSDTTVRWLPRIRYNLIIPDLSPEEYRAQSEALKPLVSFLKEWLLPFDLHCEIAIKENDVDQQIENGRLALNYNTELNK